MEFFIRLPIPSTKRKGISHENVFDLQAMSDQQLKLFWINLRLVSKVDAKELNGYLNKEGGGEFD